MRATLRWLVVAASRAPVVLALTLGGPALRRGCRLGWCDAVVDRVRVTVVGQRPPGLARQSRWHPRRTRSREPAHRSSSSRPHPTASASARQHASMMLTDTLPPTVAQGTAEARSGVGRALCSGACCGWLLLGPSADVPGCVSCALATPDVQRPCWAPMRCTTAAQPQTVSMVDPRVGELPARSAGCQWPPTPGDILKVVTVSDRLHISPCQRLFLLPTVEPETGIEPATCCLQDSCSAELRLLGPGLRALMRELGLASPMRLPVVELGEVRLPDPVGGVVHQAPKLLIHESVCLLPWTLQDQHR